jgi:hypothetical protein
MAEGGKQFVEIVGELTGVKQVERSSLLTLNSS